MLKGAALLTIDDLDDIVTTAEAAERLGITQKMVRHYADRGKIHRVNPVCLVSCDLLHEHIPASVRPHYRLKDIARAERDSYRNLMQGRRPLA